MVGLDAFGRGHIPDPPAAVALRSRFAVLARRLLGASAGPSLPLSVDLSPYVTGNGGPGVLNQGKTGACVGHAIAGAITTRMAVRKTPIALVSPIGVYTIARAMGRPSPSTPLTDSDVARISMILTLTPKERKGV